MSAAITLREAYQGAYIAYGPSDPRTVELFNATIVYSEASTERSNAIVNAYANKQPTVLVPSIGDAAAQEFIAEKSAALNLSQETKQLLQSMFAQESAFEQKLGAASVSDPSLLQDYEDTLALSNEVSATQSRGKEFESYLSTLDEVETAIVNQTTPQGFDVVDNVLIVPERTIVKIESSDAGEVTTPPPTTIIDVLPPPVPPVVLPPPVPPTTIVDVFPRPKEPAASNALLYGAGALALLLLLRRS